MTDPRNSTAMALVVRCSSLSSYAECGRRAAARIFNQEIRGMGYVLRQTIRGIGAVCGSSVHKGAAVELAEKARTGDLPPMTVAVDAATDELHEQLAQGEVIFDGGNGATHSRGEAILQVASMTRAYHSVVAPQVQPVLVEQRLEAEVEPGLVLSGQADLIAHEPGAIRDLKTGARAPAGVAPQVGAYSLIARSHQHNITEARTDFVRRVSVGRAQPDPVTTTLELQHAEVAAMAILRHMVSDLRTFREGDPAKGLQPGDAWAFVANPASNLCSEKWCPCWGVTGPNSFCHEWVKR